MRNKKIGEASNPGPVADGGEQQEQERRKAKEASWNICARVTTLLRESCFVRDRENDWNDRGFDGALTKANTDQTRPTQEQMLRGMGRGYRKPARAGTPMGTGTRGTGRALRIGTDPLWKGGGVGRVCGGAEMPATV